MQVNLGQQGVSGALESSLQCRGDAVGFQQWTLPVTLFDTGAVNQMQVRDAHFAGGAKDTTEHLWAG